MPLKPTATSIGEGNGWTSIAVPAGNTDLSFGFAFPFFAYEDIGVEASDGTMVVRLVYNTDYSVSGVANADGIYPTGTITMMALPDDVVLTIFRETGLVRLSDFPLTGFLDRQALNVDLDRGMVADQDLRRKNSLSLRFAETDLALVEDLELPPYAEAPLMLVGFDELGELVYVPQAANGRPTGPAGGVLDGTYPNPGFAPDPVFARNVSIGLTPSDDYPGFHVFFDGAGDSKHPVADLAAWWWPSGEGPIGELDLTSYLGAGTTATGAYGGGLWMLTYGGTPDAPAAVKDGDELGWLGVSGWAGTHVASGPGINFDVEGTPGGPDGPMPTRAYLPMWGSSVWGGNPGWDIHPDGNSYWGINKTIHVDPTGYTTVGFDAANGNAQVGVTIDDDLGGVWIEDNRAGGFSQVWINGLDGGGWGIINPGPTSTSFPAYPDWLIFNHSGTKFAIDPTGLLHATEPGPAANDETVPTTAWVHDRIAAIVIPPIPPSLPPSGAAGGDLAGTYPNPTIGNGKVTPAKIAPAGTNGFVLTTVAGAAAWAAASGGGGTAISIGVTPPASPSPGALWWFSDGSTGGGQMYIYYDDGNTQQWVPAAAAAQSVTPPVFTKSYVSPPQAVVAAGLITLAHGFGTKPLVTTIRLRCLVAELGYAVGQEPEWYSGEGNSGATSGRGCAIWSDGVNVNCRVASATTPLEIINATTGGYAVLTLANWAIILSAFA